MSMTIEAQAMEVEPEAKAPVEPLRLLAEDAADVYAHDPSWLKPM